MNLEDVPISQVGLIERAQVAGEVPQVEFLADSLLLPESADFLLHEHAADGAFHLLLAEVLHPMSFGFFVLLDEVVGDPPDSDLVGEVGTLAVEELVHLFDQEGVVLLSVDLQAAHV